ncbi:hypothetical protein AcV5_001312 [Taiwanofungus camphoratus]|nr:hypothetical protein AcV5_001312 [Antrodia cinnamomea]
MKVVSRQYSLHPGTIYKHSEEDDCIWRHGLFKDIVFRTKSLVLAKGDDGYLFLSSSSTETPSANSLLRLHPVACRSFATFPSVPRVHFCPFVGSVPLNMKLTDMLFSNGM